MGMERWKGRVAVVSDAYNGVGFAIAKSLVEYGMDVIGCGKEIKAIEELSNELVMKDVPGRLIPMTLDISKESDIIKLFEKIRDSVGRVDVCVNSAAICSVSNLLDGDTADWMNMFQVNVIGKGIVTREAIKLMKEKGIDDGHIININSKHIITNEHEIQGSSHENPHMYQSSKEAAKHFTHGVRCEMAKQKSKMRITTILIDKVHSPTLQHFMNRKIDDEDNKALLSPSAVADTLTYVLGTPAHIEISDIVVKATGSSTY